MSSYRPRSLRSFIYRIIRVLVRLGRILEHGATVKTFIMEVRDSSRGFKEGVGRLASSADLRRMGNEHPNLEAKLKSRLVHGDLCFVAVEGVRIVSSMWVAMGELDVFGTTIRLHRDEAYIYDVYTDPSFRRRGIASGVILSALSQLRQMGISTAYAAVDDDNPISLQMFESLGFTKVGEIVAMPYLDLDQLKRIMANHKLRFRLLGCRGYIDESRVKMKRLFEDLPLLPTKPRSGNAPAGS